jgi:hypothetical protein
MHAFDFVEFLHTWEDRSCGISRARLKVHPKNGMTILILPCWNHTQCQAELTSWHCPDNRYNFRDANAVVDSVIVEFANKAVQQSTDCGVR